MKASYISGILFLILMYACGHSGNKQNSTEIISDVGRQDSIFKKLLILTNNKIPENKRNDSLSFLILPVHATCPYCRKKTVDSILKYQSKLTERHFIIISANGGRKIISSFFKERGKELPVIENKLFLYSINLAFKYDLYEDKPTMYYTFKERAYKKVASLPATVKSDLHIFFQGGNQGLHFAKK